MEKNVRRGVFGRGSDPRSARDPLHHPEVAFRIAHHEREGVLDFQDGEGGFDADDLVQLQRSDLGGITRVVGDVDALEQIADRRG